jgi:hypothetical protein
LGYDRPCGRWLNINEGSCDDDRIAKIIGDTPPDYWLAVVDGQALRADEGETPAACAGLAATAATSPTASFYTRRASLRVCTLSR